MKKFTLIAAAALLLGATSCNHDDGHKMETTYSVRTYSLVTDSKGNSTISPTTYSFAMNLIDQVCTVSIENLILDGVTASATTRQLPFVGYNLVLGGDDNNTGNTGNTGNYGDKWGAACYLVESANATAEGGRTITNFMGDLTTASNTLNPILLTKLREQLYVDPIIYPGGSANNSIYTETQLNLDEYRVMTFWCDMLYTGVTTKTKMNPMSTQEDKDGVIRVYLNLQKASEYKATVYFYNFKTTSVGEDGKETTQTADFKLVDVPVVFDGNGFRIQGDKLVPVSLKDKKEMPEYTMNTFILGSQSNMTGIMCRFMLPDKTSVSFGGYGLYGHDISDFH